MSQQNSNHQTAECFCRVCGQPMNQAVQGFGYSRETKEYTRFETYVDCRNDACPMWMQTFELEYYPHVDLAMYAGAREMHERIWREGREKIYADLQQRHGDREMG